MKTDARTFAQKILDYPGECARRKAAGETPISLACWCGTAARPLLAALRAETAAFADAPAAAGDLRLTFVSAGGAEVHFAAAAAPVASLPEGELPFYERPLPLGDMKPQDYLQLTRKGLV